MCRMNYKNIFIVEKSHGQYLIKLLILPIYFMIRELSNDYFNLLYKKTMVMFKT